MNEFSKALRRHDQTELRDAFEWCNQQNGLVPYDRTILGRWLNGSLPSRANFVQQLSTRLNDPRIYQAWTTLKNDDSAKKISSVRSRFNNLEPSEREQAYELIKRDHFTSFLAARKEMTLRYDLRDGDDADVFDLATTCSFVAALPANAIFAIVPTYDEQALYYNNESCLYRERVHLKPSRLASLFETERFAKQYLTYRAIDGSDISNTVEGKQIQPGVFKFDNDAIESAHVKLSINYPFPRQIRMFPVVFGHYQLVGTVEISLHLHSQDAESPSGMALLTNKKFWTSESLYENELTIRLGKPGSYVEGTGVLLSWDEVTKPGITATKP